MGAWAGGRAQETLKPALLAEKTTVTVQNHAEHLKSRAGIESWNRLQSSQALELLEIRLYLSEEKGWSLNRLFPRDVFYSFETWKSQAV